MMRPLLLCALACSVAAARVPAAALTAGQLVARVIAPGIGVGAGFRIRATLTTTSSTNVKDVRQLVIRGRSDRDTLASYQQLWPAEGAGNALVVRVGADHRVRGFRLQPDGVTTLTDRMMGDRFFDSDVRLEDLTLGFLYWRSPAIVGEEAIGEYHCSIVDFNPGARDRTAYSHVKAWISADPPVVVRVQQFGRDRQLLKQIDLYRMLKLGDRWSPGIITIEPADKKSRTVIEGASYNLDPTVSAADFTVDAIRKSIRIASKR